MLDHPIWRINRAVWLLLMACFSAGIAPAQQPACALKIEELRESVELRGFHVGMTLDQATTEVPQIRLARRDQFGVARISINPSFDPSFDRHRFVDVRTISLEFLDGRLVSLWIGYESTFKWQTLDIFVAGISKSLNLPAEWTTQRGGRQLNCAGFSVFASMIAGSPSIRISDDAAQEAIATRREAAAAATEIVIGDQTTRVYYPSDCAALTAVTEINRVKFKDRDQAEKAGFKPAKDCQ